MRGATKDVDQSIQEVGGAFTADVSPESVAFEKFLVCAIPDLDKGYPGRARVPGRRAERPGQVHDRRAREVQGLVQNVNKDAKPEPSKTFKTKKFVEEDQRRLQAWEYCRGKRSRKGRRRSTWRTS